MVQNRLARRLSALVLGFALLTGAVNLPLGGRTAAADAAVEAELYVSPSGNDSNPGTEAAPLRTIAKARDVVRTLNDDMEGDIVVYLRGGEHAVTGTIELDERDSGSNGYNIVYTNYPGETPVLTGGVRLAGGWTSVGGSIYKLDAEGLDFRQLYIDGRRETRARMPNAGTEYSILSWTSADKTIQIDSSEIDNWDRFGQVEMVIQQHWAEGMVPLDSYTVTGDTANVALSQPSRNIIFNRAAPVRTANSSYHFENAYEFLDEPGEWYLNQDTDELYYMPRAGENLATAVVTVPQTETLLKLQGTSLTTPVHHVRFSGLTFAYTTFMKPNEGLLIDQAIAYSRSDGGWDRLPAAVYLESADDITFEGNRFTHTGATAIDLYRRAHDNRVVGNAFVDLSAGAISQGALNEFGRPYNETDMRELAQNNVFANNYIRGYSQAPLSAVGIFSGYAQGTLIEHNEISDGAYTGISVGWGWIDEDNVSSANIVRYNNIYNVMNRLADGGGIYTLSRQQGGEIYGNYIHDLDRHAYASYFPLAAIYLDQGTSGLNIHDNVSENVATTYFHNVIGTNTLTNNDGSDPAIKAQAGLEPEYWGFGPAADGLLQTIAGHAAIRSWTAAYNGEARIVGEAINTATDGVNISIKKNGVPVLGPVTVGSSVYTHNLVVRVEEGDTLEFLTEPTGRAVLNDLDWEPQVKAEYFPVRLDIDGMTVAEQTAAPLISAPNRIVTLKVDASADITQLAPTIVLPPGASVFPASGAAQDFTNPVQYVVSDGKGRQTIWTVSVIRAADLPDSRMRGYPLNEAIADDAGWHVEGGSKTAGTGSLALSTPTGFATYQGRKYGDELLEFNVTTEQSGPGDWPCFTLRNRLNDEVLWGENNAAYTMCVKPDVLELQRFNEGERTVFYGNIGESVPLAGDAVPNTVFTFGQPNLVQFGALNVDGGVRLIANINGVNVFDYVDTAAERIEDSGYFGVLAYASPVKLGKTALPLSLNEAIADDAGWHVEGGSKTAGTGSLALSTPTGFATYQGRKYGDELLEFNVTTEQSGPGDWPCFTLRNRLNDEVLWGENNAAYTMCVKPDVLELQRFNEGERTVFYGNIGENVPLAGDAVPNTVFAFGQPNLVQFGALNVDGGVRLIANINGVNVFDYVDTAAERIEDSGYFGVLAYASPVKLGKTALPLSLNEAIADDAGWHVEGGSKTAGTGSLALSTPTGFATYQGRKYGDELLEFNVTTEQSGPGDWPCFTLRNRVNDEVLWGEDNAAYTMCVKPDVLELQRFNEGERTVFYGNIGESVPLAGDAVPNTVFTFGQPNLVQFGALNVDGGVRLIANINGVNVFDYVDTEAERIEDSGYFGVLAYASPVKLHNTFLFRNSGSDGELAARIDLLLATIDEAQHLIDDTDTGNGQNEYPQWAKDDLVDAIADAEDALDDEERTVATIDAARTALLAAIDAFGETTAHNVALDKAASASSVYPAGDSYAPGNVVDGNTSTGWSPGGSGSAGHWWQIDLGAPYAISQINLVTRQDLDQEVERRNFEVQASNDPDFATYTVLGSQGSTALAYQATWTIRVTDPNAYRYVRVAKTVEEYFFINEVEVFSGPTPPSEPETNLAAGKTASASSVYPLGETFAPGKAVDGSMATGWSPGGDGIALHWWKVDLGDAYTLGRINLMTRQDVDQEVERRNFEVRASNDPDFATYTVLGSQGSTALAYQATWTTEVTDPTAYRYIRVAKTVEEYFFINEVEVFET